MPTAPPTLTAAPTSPDRADRATFAARAVALDDFTKNVQIPELQASLDNVYTNAVDAYNSASTATTQASTATTQAATATAQAAIASAQAASALNAPGTNATSTTSTLIGTGSKTVAIQTGKLFSVGQPVLLASAANPSNQMVGQIAAHDSGTGSLTVNVAAIGGSGTYADWVISLSALNPGTSVVWTGPQTFKGYADTVHTITDGAAFAIDPGNGAVQTVTLGASRTPVLANFASGQTVILGINDGAGYSITWTSVAPTWVRPGGAGAAPTLHATNYTWVLIWKVGATVYAAEVGKP